MLDTRPTTSDSGAPKGGRTIARVRTGRVRHAARWEGGLVLGVDFSILLVCALVWHPDVLTSFVSVAVPILTFLFNGSYRRPRITLSALNNMKATVIPATVPLLIVSVLAELRDGPAGDHGLAITVVPALVASRVLSCALLRRLRRGGRLVRPTVILGSGAIAERLLAQLRDNASSGIDVVGYLDVAPSATLTDVPFLGSFDQLDRVLDRVDARVAIVAFSSTHDGSLVPVLRSMDPHGLEILLVPRLFEWGPPRATNAPNRWGASPSSGYRGGRGVVSSSH